MDSVLGVDGVFNSRGDITFKIFSIRRANEKNHTFREQDIS